MMRVGVIGCGYWGPNLIRNLLENRKCTGVTVCDPDPASLARARHRFPTVECVGSVDELLRDRAVEAVLIATPVTTHFALARACLRSGRHTFVEKPLTSTAAEAEELIRIADRAGVTLMVGHTFEYSPPVVKIREIIESGSMGEIFYISAIRVNLGIHQRDVSVVWDLAPHDLSMLFYWLGEVPTAVTMTDGAFVQPLISDVAFINLQFGSGKIANIQASWLSPSKLRQTTIVGSHKMLIYDDTNAMERVKVFDRGVEFKDPQTFNEFTLTYRTGDIVSPHVSTAEPLGIEMDHFLECARSGATPRTDGQSGLRVVRVLEAIERSGRNGNRLERIDWGRTGTSVAPGVLDGAGVPVETGNGDGRYRPPAGLPALVNGAMAASRGTDS
jgi:predicted dehydrogenase